MSDYPLSKYSAKIKDVYIELKDYQFFHSPYNDSAIKDRFIGREKVKSRIISILEKTDVKSGAYLITGFRGMGKTSVVREALDDFNSQEKNNTDNESRNLLDSLISKSMKVLRIFFCCIFTYFIIQFFIPDLIALDYSTFVIFSYILFSVFFLIKEKRIFDKLSESLKNRDKEPTKDIGEKEPKPKSNFTELLLKRDIFPTLLFLNIILSILLLSFQCFGGKALNYWSLLATFPLLTIFLIVAFLITKSNEIFEAIWNGFKIVFIVILFILSGMFFFNYAYFCEKGGWCNSTNAGMNNYFPVITFQKSSAPGNNVPNTNSANESQSQKNLNPEDIEKIKNENKEILPKTESDAVTIVFRLIVIILFSYIILSIIVFIIDLIYLVRVWGFKNKKAEESKKYERFEINLSQDSLDEMEILRRMTINIENYWQERKFELGNGLFNRKLYLPWRFIIQKVDRPRKNQFESSYKSISGKLNLLKNRISGQLTTRRERKTPPNVTTPIAGLAEISMPLGTYTNNDEVAYPIASVKEAEDQLREILNDIDKLRHPDKKSDIPQFVFIIDELDKIDPHNNSVVQEREYSNPVFDKNIYADDTNRFRQRREAVGRLLANLKGFLNVAKAKFFFIGGREMFDADLADIADRESFYSSIFNDVIYVESFFKDYSGRDSQGAGGITQMTETYICNIILNDLRGAETKKKSKDKNKDNIEAPFKVDDLNLKTLRKLIIKDKKKSYLKFLPSLQEADERKKQSNGADEDETGKDESNRQTYKILSTLQNYIVYSTYRSSGTPKKLTSLTEQLIVKGPKFEKNREIKNEQFFEENVVVLHKEIKDNDDLSDRLFLKFGFNTQYEIGLTSNLYRPYLIANSRHLKSLGDKLLFSSSFIIDHILKFHPFGFSWRNLELIPEVVLINREPNLREFIEELMRFYSLNYIRDTVSGIFDYRFRSIIRRELIHLSKTSDLSAAAFNFTLDESLATKRHYKRKFIELSEKYKDYQTIEGDNKFVHSLYFVQTILGDLHFYDKEYDEAILFYTESIQTLRMPNAITERKITRHQFLLWVKNKLKLGLTLEKMRTFDSAFSIYKTLILDSERYFRNIVSKKDNDSKKRDEIVNKNDKKENLIEAEDHEHTSATLAQDAVDQQWQTYLRPMKDDGDWQEMSELFFVDLTDAR